MPLEDGADLAGTIAREGSSCYVLPTLRHERRGGRFCHGDKKATTSSPPPALYHENIIVKRLLPPMDMASLNAAKLSFAVLDGGWDYEA